jgi:hypothetical protein
MCGGILFTVGVRLLQVTSNRPYICDNLKFLGAFAVRPSVRMEQLGSNRTDFYEIWYLSVLWKNCRDISSLIKIWQE